MTLMILKVVLVALICFYIIFFVIKTMKTRKLFRSFGYQLNIDDYQELNYEYINAQSISLDQQLIQDLELPLFFNKINYTYTSIGREYLFDCFFEKNIDLSSLEYKISQFKDEKKLKRHSMKCIFLAIIIVSH